MATSRSALEFLRRNGVVEAPARPSPRLAVCDLLVHFVPHPSPPGPPAGVLRRYEGDPPPDRGAARPWPSRQENDDEE